MIPGGMMAEVKPGMFVETCRRLLNVQPNDGMQHDWLPFLVTHVDGNGSLDGVMFTGRPAQTGDPRQHTRPLVGITRGDGPGHWRPYVTAPARGRPRKSET